MSEFCSLLQKLLYHMFYPPVSYRFALSLTSSHTSTAFAMMMYFLWKSW